MLPERNCFKACELPEAAPKVQTPFGWVAPKHPRRQKCVTLVSASRAMYAESDGSGGRRLIDTDCRFHDEAVECVLSDAPKDPRRSTFCLGEHPRSTPAVGSRLRLATCLKRPSVLLAVRECVRERIWAIQAGAGPCNSSTSVLRSGPGGAGMCWVIAAAAPPKVALHLACA